MYLSRSASRTGSILPLCKTQKPHALDMTITLFKSILMQYHSQQPVRN